MSRICNSCHLGCLIWVSALLGVMATTAPALAQSADEIKTTITYQAGSSSVGSNLLPISTAVAAGNNSFVATTTTAYDALGNVVATDGPLPGPQDTTYFVYNAYRELVATISPDPDGAGPLPRAVERNIYNADGKPIRVEAGTAQTTDASDFVLTRFKRMTYDNVTGLLTKVEEVLP